MITIPWLAALCFALALFTAGICVGITVERELGRK